MERLLPNSLSASIASLKELTISCRASGMAPEAALAMGHGFVVYDPTMCGWYLLALEEVASACRARGRGLEAREAEAMAEAVALDVAELLWWEQGQIFVAYDLTGSRQLHGIGAMGLIPAASRALAESGLSSRVAERHLRRNGAMWGQHGFAAGSLSPGSGVGAFVQWNGNAVWGATVYWAYLLAARLGRWAEARRARDQLAGLIDAHGFREFYDAETGDPGGAGAESGFSWPTLILDMSMLSD